MLKRFSLVFAAMAITALLCACGAQNAGLSPSPSPSAAAPASPSPDIGAESPTPPLSDENGEHKKLFLGFIDENYDGLSAACFGGIAGVGFIDLDLDGSVEMLFFDAGASAAMGVQFFDIIGGAVECVSANMQPMADAFGGAHLSDATVSANYFDDFRLMEDKTTGERFFQVVSANGATDFSYRELIRFGSSDEALTLSSVSYIHEDYDIDTEERIGAEFRLREAVCSEEEYLAAQAEMAANSTDTGYEAAGVFLWENSDLYADGKAGLLAMADAALKLSANIPLPA